MNTNEPGTALSVPHYRIAIFTAVAPNKPGSWAYVAERHGADGNVLNHSHVGRQHQATAPQLELQAAIFSLGKIGRRGLPVQLLTVSDYIASGFHRHLPKWKTNGWRASSGEVKNRDLWEQLDAVARGLDLRCLRVARGQEDDLLNRAFNAAQRALRDPSIPPALSRAFHAHGFSVEQ